MESYEKIQAIGEVMGTNPAKYRQFASGGRVTSLARLIAGYHRRRGSSPSAESVMAAASMLDSDIEAHFGRSLAFAEVVLALDWGTRGEYGDSGGLSPDRLFRHVRSYAASDERAEALRLAEARRRREDMAALDGDSPVRDWNRCRDTVLEEWEKWAGGGFEPYRGRPWSAARRHVLCAAYCWLRSVGLVADDADTRLSETRALESARRECEKTGSPTECGLHALFGAMMLEGTLRAAAESGYDLGAAVRSLDGWTDGDKREMGWWRPLCAGMEGMS